MSHRHGNGTKPPTQGPIVFMIENQRSALVWRLMRRYSYVVEGLRRAGFKGGRL